ncbi:autotransporter domain-containing protein [Pseudomonas protegens]|uniref:autotransporter domain-containing protein n=1 Tax=Pseudomonas protegens TaxID=380021 RepID=UPI00301E5923
MKSRRYTTLILLLIATSYAQAAPRDLFDPMFDLGSLYNDNLGYSFAVAVSSDGSTIVGLAETEDGKTRAFRWSATLNSMQDLGSLRNDQLGSSYPSAVSADGSTIVGQADTQNGDFRAFRWTESLNSMQDLGSLRNDNLGSSAATAVSADGSTIVGKADTQDGKTRAFRWTEVLNAMQDLGSLRNDNLGHSYAIAVSSDGSTVVGLADTEDGNSRAFRWTETLNAMQDLGSLRNDNLGSSYASAVSSDGSTIVGQADTEDGNSRAFRWNEALNAMQDLGSLRNDNLGSSSASAVSSDGSTIVGQADTEDGNSRAFRWTETLNAIQDLGSLRNDNLGSSYAIAVSADGSTIVGEADTEDGNSRAFRWNEALNVMQDLGSLRNDNLGSSAATAVSADGSTIVGQAETEDGNSRAFIYRASKTDTSGIMQDYLNVLQSFPQLASETELAMAQQQMALNRLLDQSCFTGAPGLNCFRISGAVSNTGSDGNIGRRNQTQGLLTLGHGLNESMTLGVTLSSGNTRMHKSGISAKTAYGLGVWGEYSEHGSSRTGLQASVGMGINTQDNDLTRGKGLNNVQQLRGSADMQTVAGRIDLGYGFVLSSDWLITPAVALVQQYTSLDGYSENQGAITGTYKKARLNSTVADLGITGKTAINTVSSVHLGAGIGYDLNVERMRLKGTTDVPGLEFINAKSQLDRNDVRPYVSASYQYNVLDGATVSTGLRASSDTFSDTAQAVFSVSYGMEF